MYDVREDLGLLSSALHAVRQNLESGVFQGYDRNFSADDDPHAEQFLAYEKKVSGELDEIASKISSFLNESLDDLLDVDLESDDLDNQIKIYNSKYPAVQDLCDIVMDRTQLIDEQFDAASSPDVNDDVYLAVECVRDNMYTANDSAVVAWNKMDEVRDVHSGQFND